ncbi:SPFH domain / Band 7 family (plasmid) [Tsukamurella tyrosinosolvens]|uniref:Regulator of protease activity HflC, stomatin/prohibitin superfamily n=1 Tax=Tsukamurella tyrosinosolvens TaxID=57704 RepID=A0A1H4U6K2_TSUTY|nr:SPFH domain-containing protein [Tsukamurella tyrosinosolvens]KXO93016.1 hypothetical protein AXK58_14190 [Tsukamurella tyrosinosolvens]SEC64220.1 Regulator of protease activity HflC, stomatin/prohibitin superfamily [Tsukamurella tyrosinosolvens]VEH94014.1 SPFH domain / Band 7 family [Tsukamurella tyrosinosolvens]
MSSTIWSVVLVLAGVSAIVYSRRVARTAAAADSEFQARKADEADRRYLDRDLIEQGEALVRALQNKRVASRIFLGIGSLTTVLGLLILTSSCVTVVSTKNIGVVTTFGKPSRYLDNGVHLKLPWQNVTELDGAIQTQNYVDEGDKKEAITARLGNNSTARVDATVVWRIKPEAAPSLFQDYRGFDNIRDNLVTREFTAALNDTLASYNPLALPGEGDGAQNAKNAQTVLDKLRIKVGDRVEVLGVNIPVIHFDARTQDSINQRMTEINNTQVAQQRQKTAEAEAQANRILADSVRDPNVLASKCLDIVREKGGSVLGCIPLGGSVIANPK